jgi:hypothetical protein
LHGGECLDPYASPWAERFTVVGCTSAHAAQLTRRGSFGADAGAAFPGTAALQSQTRALCTAPTVIDYPAAAAYSDLQFAAAYPVTQEQWAAGERDYYCFVTRSSGEPLTTSVAVPQAASAGERSG